MAKDILSMTALELSDDLQKRALKSVDIAAACLDAGRNQTSPVYIKLTEQRAMEEAKAAEENEEAQPTSRRGKSPYYRWETGPSRQTQ